MDDADQLDSRERRLSLQMAEKQASIKPTSGSWHVATVGPAIVSSPARLRREQKSYNSVIIDRAVSVSRPSRDHWPRATTVICLFGSFLPLFRQNAHRLRNNGCHLGNMLEEGTSIKRLVPSALMMDRTCHWKE